MIYKKIYNYGRRKISKEVFRDIIDSDYSRRSNIPVCLYYVPFSNEGVKAGILNNVKHKGVVFKTWEGELIQSGFRPGQQGLQSNEFNFSVEDEELAKHLMQLSGQQVKLHYKEYYGALLWRGYSKFIVDSIYIARPYDPSTELPFPGEM